MRTIKEIIKYIYWDKHEQEWCRFYIVFTFFMIFVFLMGIF